MGIALPEATARQRTDAKAVTHRLTLWGVVTVYLVIAVLLTWRLWAGLGRLTTANDPVPGDADLFAWDMWYAAHALSHGHLPALVTTALNAPRGINLMWNTSLLFPAIALTPLTSLAGPQVSLTVLLTLGYAGSATSMLWLLRSQRASLTAAAIGGAVYGFSPAMMGSGISHYNIEFAVLPPLIIDATLRIVTGRRRPLLTGIWLGALVSAQLFTEEELLADIAIAGLVLVVVLAVSRPKAILGKVRGAAIGLGAGVVTTLVIAGHALWIQFHGPLTEHGSPFPNAKFTNSFASFVTPGGNLLFHTASSAAYAASDPAGLWEYLSYLGVPLLALLVVAIVLYWRDPRVRAAGVTWAALEILSLGGNSAFLPFHWLQGLPLLTEMLPSRLSLLADGAAAAVLAFWFDAVRWRAAVRLAVTALALLPLVPLPLQTTAAATVPAGWNTVFASLRLSSHARVLVVPVPYSHKSQAMRWMADTGEPGELIAGWFLGPTPSGQAATEYWGPAPTHNAVMCLDALQAGASSDPRCSSVPAALKYWRPAAVVAETRPGSSLARFLTKLYGKPAAESGQTLAWKS